MTITAQKFTEKMHAFVVACIDGNSIKELEDCLERGPFQADLTETGLTEIEWLACVFSALTSKRDDSGYICPAN